MEFIPESVLDVLNDFEKKSSEIPQLLETYLRKIAENGDIIFPWPKLKPLLKRKLELVLDEFYETCPVEITPPVPNFEAFNFDDLKKTILQAIDAFTSAPFTIQRICELVTDPKKHYNRTDKYMRGIEKNVLVISTIEARLASQEVDTESSTMVNGMIGNSPSDENDCYNGHKIADNATPDSVNTPATRVLLENFANVFPSAACIPSASNICVNREIDSTFMENTECVATLEVISETTVFETSDDPGEKSSQFSEVTPMEQDYPVDTPEYVLGESSKMKTVTTYSEQSDHGSSEASCSASSELCASESSKNNEDSYDADACNMVADDAAYEKEDVSSSNEDSKNTESLKKSIVNFPCVEVPMETSEVEEKVIVDCELKPKVTVDDVIEQNMTENTNEGKKGTEDSKHENKVPEFSALEQEVITDGPIEREQKSNNLVTCEVEVHQDGESENDVSEADSVTREQDSIECEQTDVNKVLVCEQQSTSQCANEEQVKSSNTVEVETPDDIDSDEITKFDQTQDLKSGGDCHQDSTISQSDSAFANISEQTKNEIDTSIKEISETSVSTSEVAE